MVCVGKLWLVTIWNLQTVFRLLNILHGDRTPKLGMIQLFVGISLW
jgi:hypothetical protein